MTTFDNDYYSAVSITPAVSLKNPRIGYQNRVSAVTASTSLAGFPASALLNAFTYEIWKPSVLPATLTIDLGQAYPIDYLGIAAHELTGCRIALKSSPTGTTYTERAAATIENDNDILLLFDSVTARYWQLEITRDGITSSLYADFVNGIYSAAEDLTDPGGTSISVLYLGQALAMPYSIYGGHTPGIFSDKTVFSDSESEGGQFLGRSIVRQSKGTSFNFKNLSAAWYRANFVAFTEAAKTLPYFISWRPIDKANETLFGTTSQDIVPSNTGTRDFMQVSFSIKAYRSA